MKSYQFLFALVITLSLLAGCKKDDDKEAEPTKTALLTAKPWKLDKIIAFSQDVTNLLGAEVLGELGNSNVQFKSDGTYESTNRTTNAKTSGKWEFNTEQTKVILNKGTARELTLDVIQLSANNLDLQQKISKSTIDVSLLPAQYQLLFAAVPDPIVVDIKLIPAQ